MFLLGAGSLSHAADPNEPVALRAGLVTDMHYADKPPRGSRHYRETLPKLAEARDYFAKQAPEFIVELGDFIDAADSVETELSYLKRVLSEFAKLPGQKHYVLGKPLRRYPDKSRISPDRRSGTLLLFL